MQNTYVTATQKKYNINNNKKKQQDSVRILWDIFYVFYSGAPFY